MLKRFAGAVATATLLLAADQALSLAWAKPPDLPLSFRDLCRPSGQADACQPALIEALAALDQTEKTSRAPTVFESVGGQPAEQAKDSAVRRMLEIGSACELRGDHAMARNCYEEALRMDPKCPQAAVAMERLEGMLPRVQRLEILLNQSEDLRKIKGEWQRFWMNESGAAEESEPMPRQDAIPQNRLDMKRVHEAKHMLQMGQRFQETGDMDNAFRCYQESHMICPACQYGQQSLERMLAVEHLKAVQRRGNNFEEQEPPVAPKPMSRADFQRREESHTLYLLGERCRRSGDVRMAYGLYQESHLVCPECFYGMKSIERMTELENPRRPRPPHEEAEEQEMRVEHPRTPVEMPRSSSRH